MKEERVLVDMEVLPFCLGGNEREREREKERDGGIVSNGPGRRHLCSDEFRLIAHLRACRLSQLIQFGLCLFELRRGAVFI